MAREKEAAEKAAKREATKAKQEKEAAERAAKKSKDPSTPEAAADEAAADNLVASAKEGDVFKNRKWKYG